MLVTLLGILTVSKLVQDLNALKPMLETLLPMLTVFKLEQPLNAYSPMLVTLLGILTVSKLVHDENALPPILIMPSGISTCPLASGVIAHPAKTRVSCVANKRIDNTIYNDRAQVLPIHMFISYFK